LYITRSQRFQEKVGSVFLKAVAVLIKTWEPVISPPQDSLKRVETKGNNGGIHTVVAQNEHTLVRLPAKWVCRNTVANNHAKVATCLIGFIPTFYGFQSWTNNIPTMLCSNGLKHTTPTTE
jgi:hypothetical protein